MFGCGYAIVYGGEPAFSLLERGFGRGERVLGCF
jgi:hypothetical protein